jgi:hypothetical protein
LTYWNFYLFIALKSDLQFLLWRNKKLN